MNRIKSIDITRGIVMVIMALDHVRDLMHVDSISQSPTNLATTTPTLFFTRWITHLCAPTFVFLAGTSAYLSFKKSGNLTLNRTFLFKRGFYLILLEFIVVNFLLFFDPLYHTLLFEVIAAIGFGFIILGLLLRASTKTIGIIGLLIIACHNLFPLLPLPENAFAKTLLSMLFSPGALPVSSTNVFVMAYPPIPWLGIMLVGFASGKLFEMEAQNRKKAFLKLGLLALGLFIAIRFINIYGDTVPWSSQKNTLFTILSFINVTKYPPSLLFCLAALGVMLLLLSYHESSDSKFSQLVSVYGKVPLFYFLLHFLVIHLIMIGLMFLQGFSWSQLDFASGTFGRPKGVVSGVELWAIYLLWIGIVVLLYKPCLWYGQYKKNHPNGWLKYL